MNPTTNETATPLPSVFCDDGPPRAPTEIADSRVDELRAAAKLWVGPEHKKLARNARVDRLGAAKNDESAARRVLKSLSAEDRAVLGVYKRYGGNVDGEIIRIELLTRGLLEIVEHRHTEYYSQRRWKCNPIQSLAARMLLVNDHTSHRANYSFHSSVDETTRPFQRYSISPILAGVVESAPPPSWSIPASTVEPTVISQRTPAEVALDLSRVLAFVARGTLKLRRDGQISNPSLRSMEKAAPIDGDGEFPLPDPQVLYFEVLRHAGAVQTDNLIGTAAINPAGARLLFDSSDANQARAWARGWLHARIWDDGVGSVEQSYAYIDDDEFAFRQRIAWALGSLARAGDPWYDMASLCAALESFRSDRPRRLRPFAWLPTIRPVNEADRADHRTRLRADTIRCEDLVYANMVLITLRSLGLVAHGRPDHRPESPHLFRLTEFGRAVFGAPDCAPEPETRPQRFFVVQPNFDVVAYLDRADAKSAAQLGKFAECDRARSGPVQSFRLTQPTIYQAQEAGVTEEQIRAFFEDHAMSPVPTNVTRSLADWAKKRESLVIRPGITLLGFPLGMTATLTSRTGPEPLAAIVSSSRVIHQATAPSCPRPSNSITSRPAAARGKWMRQARFARASPSTFFRAPACALSRTARSRHGA